ncbi:MAG: hypothetical protein HYY50_01420 [Candidatus Kerfeldbacteria bacterium]|nr:hypothetical protein [Candidatus Kerfeldbacteria bacterium]
MKLRFLIVMLAIVAALSGPVIAQSSDTSTSKPIEFTPEVELPGIFSGKQTVDRNFIGTYLRAIYVYFIWAVGAMATVMIVYGGIKWVAAAGNPGRIQDARDVINNAIIGIIIALTSVVLLNLISPRFTIFSLPDLQPVEAKPFLGKYNAAYDCYEEIACPKNYTQTLGGQCGSGGVWAHVNPGQIPCGTRNGVYAICCRRNDGSECRGYTSVNGRQTYSGECFNVTSTPSYTIACQDSTPCGQVNGRDSCRGIYCGADQVCYLKAQTSGVCINPGAPGASTRYTFTGLECGSGTGTMFFTNGIDCGRHASGEFEGSPITVWGTKSSCPAGQYCKVQPPAKGAGSECVVVQGTVCSPLNVL